MFTIIVSIQGPLMNWLKVNFSQTFSAWVHLKALRVFTESVLRYSMHTTINYYYYYTVLLLLLFLHVVACTVTVHIAQLLKSNSKKISR